MEQILRYRNQIYGFCALWIMFFHVQRTVGTCFDIPLLTSFIRLGNCGVDVFLFLSGYCLTLSYKKDSRIGIFYKKRFFRLLIPFFVIAIPYYLFKNVTRGASDGIFPIACGFLRDITGLSFLQCGVQTTWFVFAILWLYILFPLIYRIIIYSRKAALILMFVLYGIIILSYLEPFHQNYAIALTRFPVFVLGSIMAYYKVEPRMNVKWWIFFLGWIFVFMGVAPINDIVYSRSLPRPFLWMFFITLVLPIVYTLGWLFGKTAKEGVVMKLLLFTGNLSLEVYMVHVMILNIAKWYNLMPQIALYAYMFVLSTSLLISYLMNRIVWVFTKEINSRPHY